MFYKWQKPQKSQYIDDERIGEYWNHYVLMYIDSRNQVQMQGLGIDKIKDTLINLVYSFKCTQRINCVKFLKKMEQK